MHFRRDASATGQASLLQLGFSLRAFRLSSNHFHSACSHPLFIAEAACVELASLGAYQLLAGAFDAVPLLQQFLPLVAAPVIDPLARVAMEHSSPLGCQQARPDLQTFRSFCPSLASLSQPVTNRSKPNRSTGPVPVPSALPVVPYPVPSALPVVPVPAEVPVQ